GPVGADLGAERVHAGYDTETRSAVAILVAILSEAGLGAEAHRGVGLAVSTREALRTGRLASARAVARASVARADPGDAVVVVHARVIESACIRHAHRMIARLGAAEARGAGI